VVDIWRAFTRAQTVANGAMIVDLHKMLHSLGHKDLSAQFVSNSIVHTEVHHFSAQEFGLAAVGAERVVVMPQTIARLVG
jgi:hypothetical protein